MFVVREKTTLVNMYMFIDVHVIYVFILLYHLFFQNCPRFFSYFLLLRLWIFELHGTINMYITYLLLPIILILLCVAAGSPVKCRRLGALLKPQQIVIIKYLSK